MSDEFLTAFSFIQAAKKGFEIFNTHDRASI
jgi:hypothetical protein